MEGITVNQDIIRLQFYSVPPIDTISLDEVEHLAIERLKVLRCIESISLDYIKGSKEFNEQLRIQLPKCSDLGKSLINYSENKSTNSISNDIKNDNLSHFILLLGYCQTEELSQWFIDYEMELFKYRFDLERRHNSNNILKFMAQNNIILEKASKEDFRILNEIYSSLPTGKNVYKVKIDKALGLIKLGKVFVKNRIAYLLDDDLVSIVASYFRSNVSHSLSFMRMQWPYLNEESRLKPILSTIHKKFLGKDYSETNKVEIVTASEIPMLSKKSFPPCMQKIHNSLIRDSHLRHWARLQYSLFLKGIGLPLVESLKFFKKNFESKFDSQTFDKRYSYSLRHIYGQEGKRVNLKPYSCQKIITTNPPQPSDCHGCPFRHSDVQLLIQNLRKTTKVTYEQIESIKSKANQNHYQISCRNYFKVIHGLPDDYPITINHPNEYFEESQKFLNNKQ